jgi:GT2 family glycosyltransferase
VSIDISIIIVNWRVRDLLQQCLASLRSDSGLPPERMQVIVVDNDSRDGSTEMVAREFPDVELIVNTDNRGFGQANNQALPLCRGRFVLLLNPDTVVQGQAIRRLIERIEGHSDVAAIGCRLLNADGSLQRWTGGAFPHTANLASHYLFLDRLLPRRLRPSPLYLDADVRSDIEVDWVSGACMILRPAMLDGKLFDPEFFMYAEDMELCHRLKSAGHRILYSPCASIIHYQGASIKQQQGDVLLSSLQGPRQFYRRMRGERAVRWFDRLTITGFALRWALYSVASCWRPGGYAQKAAASRALMHRALRIRQA